MKEQANIRNEGDLVVEKGDVISAYFYCSNAISISNNRIYSQMVVSVK